MPRPLDVPVRAANSCPGTQIRGVSIADGDRARFVEQHGIDVACRLDCLAALGEDVGLQRAIHPGDSDRSEQCADRRRYQANQQCTSVGTSVPRLFNGSEIPR